MKIKTNCKFAANCKLTIPVELYLYIIILIFKELTKNENFIFFGRTKIRHRNDLIECKFIMIFFSSNNTHLLTFYT
jgi:hypothetical protein